MLSEVDDTSVLAIGSWVTHSILCPNDPYLGSRTSPVNNVSDDLRYSDTRLSSKPSENTVL